ncbi:MAG: mucoidy inhibitor MuiA family protein [Phycisphaerae bacterium]|nr:mucoidy inhibitor MuiA family protein [Phycisphaerae bacterium]
MNRSVLWIILVVVVCGVSQAWAVERIETPGKVDAVTVYRGQALVTRVIELGGPAGLREVVVTDLPEHVVGGSIHAESANGVEVRSVRYRVRPVKEDVREEVRELDEQIRQVLDLIEANQRHKELVGEQRDYLSKLEEFVAPTANVELTRGVLNAETLMELTGFLFAQRKVLAESELELRLENRDLDGRLELLKRQRHELTGSSSRTAREAVVFVNLLKAHGGRVRVRYLVDRATWSPSYNVRTDADRSDVVVEYNASIQQMSGEEWGDVAMTLSTATPALVAKAPVLTPLSIALAPASAGGRGQQAGKGGGYHETRRKLMQQRFQLDTLRNYTGVFDSNGEVQMLQSEESVVPESGQSYVLAGADMELNRLAGELQNLDLTSREKITRQPTVRPKTDAGVTVTYQLASRTSLPSRSDHQLIRIAPLTLRGQFYKVATPVLTSYVYEEAAVTNASDLVLLAGPVSTYVAGQFVGQGVIPTVSVGESFTVGFGIDSSLRASRELVERKGKIQGGNRVVDFTYRLALENFGTDPACVRLLDRLPKAKKSEIKLTLSDTGRELSNDAGYQHTGRKKGILRWEIEVPAHAEGPEATSIEYRFRLEYDKQMTIAGMPTVPR